MKNSINRNIPRGFLNISKLILTAALIFLTTVDLTIAIVKNENQEVYPVDYYTPAIKIATFVSKRKLPNDRVDYFEFPFTES